MASGGWWCKIAGSDRRRFPAQQPRRHGVEGRDPGLAAVFAQEVLDPRPHLFGRLVRERHGQHFIRPGEPVYVRSGVEAGG